MSVLFVSALKIMVGSTPGRSTIK